MMLRTLIDILTVIQADNGNLDVAIGLPANLQPSEVFNHAELGPLGNYFIGRVLPLEVHPNPAEPELATEARSIILITANPE